MYPLFFFLTTDFNLSMTKHDMMNLLSIFSFKVLKSIAILKIDIFSDYPHTPITIQKFKGEFKKCTGK